MTVFQFIALAQLDVEELLGAQVVPQDLVLSIEFVEFVLQDQDAFALVRQLLSHFVKVSLLYLGSFFVLSASHGSRLDVIYGSLAIV